MNFVFTTRNVVFKMMNFAQMEKLAKQAELDIETRAAGKTALTDDLATKEFQIKELQSQLEQAKAQHPAAEAQPMDGPPILNAQSPGVVQAALDEHEKAADKLRVELHRTSSSEAFLIAQDSLKRSESLLATIADSKPKGTTIALRPVMTDTSSDEESDDSGVVAYTTGFGSRNLDIHLPSPGRTSIVVTGQQPVDPLYRSISNDAKDDSGDEHDALTGDVISPPRAQQSSKARTSTEDFVTSRQSLVSMLAPQTPQSKMGAKMGATTQTPLSTNELGEEYSLVTQPVKPDERLSEQLQMAEADLRGVKAAVGSLLAELTGDCEIVTYYKWLEPEPKLTKLYTASPDWRVDWRKLSDAVAQLRGRVQQASDAKQTTDAQGRDADTTQRKLQEALTALVPLQERVDEAEREAEDANIAMVGTHVIPTTTRSSWMSLTDCLCFQASKEINLRLKEEGLESWQRDIEARAKEWQQEHATSVGALETRAKQLQTEHEASMSELRSSVYAARLEREAMAFERSLTGTQSKTKQKAVQPEPEPAPVPQKALEPQVESKPSLIDRMKASQTPEPEPETEPEPDLEPATQSITPKHRVMERRLRRLFESIDTDKNGSLSRKELSGKLKEDGELESVLEAAGWSSSYVFEQMDSDGDGSITVEEFLKLMAPAVAETADATKAGENQPAKTRVKRVKIGTLRLTQETHKDWSFDLSMTSPSVIGRAARKTDAQCVLPGTAADKSISRKHCQVEYVESTDSFVMMCLGLNVAMVNGQPVDTKKGAVALKDGDNLKIGSMDVVLGIVFADMKAGEIQAAGRPAEVVDTTLQPATLTLADVRHKYWVFELSRTAVSTIGRDSSKPGKTATAGCALPGTAADKGISRKHVQIEWVDSKFMLTCLGVNVVKKGERTIDAKAGAVELNDKDIVQVGSMEVVVSIPAAPEIQKGIVKELVRSFTPSEGPAEEAALKQPVEASAADASADPLATVEHDVDAVLAGIETSFLKEEAERKIQQIGEQHKAQVEKHKDQVEKLQARLTESETYTTELIKGTKEQEGKITKLTQDLQQSAGIASTAIAEAGKLRAALQEKHGKGGEEVLRLRAALDTANATVASAQQRNLALQKQLDEAVAEKAAEEQRVTEQATKLAEGHELEVNLLAVERDEARFNAQRYASEAQVWSAHASRNDSEPSQASQRASDAEKASQASQHAAPVDETVEKQLHRAILGGGLGSLEGTTLKELRGTEDVGPAAYEKELKTVMSEVTLKLSSGKAAGAQLGNVGSGGMRFGAGELSVLDRCREVMQKAGEPRLGASLATRRAELTFALEHSKALAHWFDEERGTLTQRFARLRDPSYLDARGRAERERYTAASKLQARMRGYMLRARFFRQLELEAAQLSFEVATEAHLRWERVRAVVDGTRPIVIMLHQICKRIDDLDRRDYARKVEAEGGGPATPKRKGVALGAVSTERRGALSLAEEREAKRKVAEEGKENETVHKSGERALQAVERLSELGFGICKRDYKRLKRRHDSRGRFLLP